MNGERSDTARHWDEMSIFLSQMGRIMTLLVNRGAVANDPIVFAGKIW